MLSLKLVSIPLTSVGPLTYLELSTSLIPWLNHGLEVLLPESVHFSFSLCGRTATPNGGGGESLALITTIDRHVSYCNTAISLSFIGEVQVLF